MAKKSGKSSLDDILAKYGGSGEMTMLSTGIKALDDISGGGLMEGALYAFWGEQGTGKSSLCAQIARKFCEEGYRVAYIDSEKSLNPVQMKIYGLTKYYEEGLLLHFDKIITMKQCDEVNAALVDDGSIKLIIIDSETELLAKDVDDIDVEGKTIGEHARQSAAMLNKLKCMVHENNLIAIVMFQARANILTTPAYGASDKKQSGGFSAKHIPDAILKVAKGSFLRDTEGNKIGHIMRMEYEKNKIAAPATIEQQFIYGVGISNKMGVIDSALEQELIEVSGKSYVLGNGHKYVGKKALYDMTDEDFEYLNKLLEE